MRIVCISDTHNMHLTYDMPEIPDGDVLVHAGDLTSRGNISEVGSALSWLDALPHKWKVIIPGNHDWLFEREPLLARAMVEEKQRMILLIDSGRTIDGVNFWGSPYQPEFFNWAFNLKRGPKLAEKWARIPEDTNVLITHTPPYGIRDIAHSHVTQRVGCEDLEKRIWQLPNLRLNVFGHIHLSYGQSDIGGVHFVNAAIADEYYYPSHKPIVIDL